MVFSDGTVASITRVMLLTVSPHSPAGIYALAFCIVIVISRSISSQCMGAAIKSASRVASPLLNLKA